ncbi:MAG: rhodanese-like domain-containing protein [Sinomicrobium sp.]|nr:rhodanese-like domain-containing protein [Sinomicrobium sp.]
MDLNQQQWAAQLQEDNDAVIIDVRTLREFEEGHIPGALNIDIYMGQGFLDAIRRLEPSKRYYVYCRSGARSAQACLLMKQLGFNSAYNLLGGFLKWRGKVAG